MVVFKCKNHHHYQQKNGKIHKETREDDQIQKIKTNLQKSIAKKQKPSNFFIKKSKLLFLRNTMCHKRKRNQRNNSESKKYYRVRN